MDLIFVGIFQLAAKFTKFFFEIGMSFLLSPEEYGKFSIFISSMIIFSKVFSLGGELFIISNSNQSAINRFHITINTLISSSLLFSLITVSYFFIDFNFQILIASFILSCINIFCSFLKSELIIKTATFFMEILWYFIIILIIFLNEFPNYPTIIISSLFLTLTINIIYLIKKHYLSPLSFKSFFKIKPSFIQLRYSFPLLFTGFLSIFLSRIDVLMLEGNINDDLIGEYNIITKISTQLLFIYQIIIVYYLPRLARVYSESLEKNLPKLHIKLVSLSSSSVILCYFTFLCIDYFFDIYGIFNLKREIFSPIFNIYFITQLISTAISFYGYFIIFEGKQKLELINTPVIILLALILNYTLIPIYGIYGATFSTCISILAVNILRVGEYIWIKTKKY